MENKLIVTKNENKQISFPKCEYKGITLLAILIIGISLISLIYYGIKQEYASGCFITGAVVIAFFSITGFFLIYHNASKVAKNSETFLPSQSQSVAYNLDSEPISSNIQQDSLTFKGNQFVELLNPQEDKQNSLNTPQLQQPHLPHLPAVLITHICGFLQLCDVGNLAATSKNIDGYKQQINKRATEYGYVGNDPDKAKEYLENLFQLIHILIIYEQIPEIYIVYKEKFPEVSIDYEATFRKLQYSVSENAQINLQTIISENFLFNITGERVDLVRLSLYFEVNPNTTKEDNSSALHDAASCGYVEIVKLLIDYGANVNALDDAGVSPLRDALRWSSAFNEDRIAQIVNLLVQNNAIIEDDIKEKVRLLQSGVRFFPKRNRRQFLVI